MIKAATTLDDTLLAYLGAWNEPDPAERARLLDRSVADDVVFIDPLADVRGRDALAEHITATRAQFPDIAFAAEGTTDAHHNVARMRWVATGKDGVLLRGLDVDEVAPDGRLARILGFFDPS